MKWRNIAVPILFCMSALTLSACGSAPPVPTAGSGPAVAARVPSAATEAQPEILVTNYADGYPTTAVEFAKGARGNATPLRLFATKAPAFGIRPDGTYWTGPYHHPNVAYDIGWVQRQNARGSVILKIAGVPDEPVKNVSTDRNGDLLLSDWSTDYYGDTCVTIEGHVRLYSAAHAFKLTRTIGQAFPCTDIIYTDGKGNIYAGYSSADNEESWYATTSISEVGPDATSLEYPARSIVFSDQYTTIQGLGTDSRGNLFALVNGQIFEFAPGKTKARIVLKGVPVSSFAIDSKNDLYVVVGTYLEEFAPGTNRPMRVIGGPATGLTNPAGITVAD
jgi:hypothetical protein